MLPINNKKKPVNNFKIAKKDKFHNYTHQ